MRGLGKGGLTSLLLSRINGYCGWAVVMMAMHIMCNGIVRAN